MHNHNSSNTKMTWLMVLGCLLPLLALGAIYLFNIPLNVIVVGALILLCPLSHILMMRSMGHGQSAMERKPEE